MSRVRPSLWTLPTFGQLPPQEQLAALYIATGPYANSAGYFRITPGDVCDGLHRQDYTEVREQFLHAISALGWHYDTATSVLYVPGWFKFYPPEVLANLRRALDDARSVHAVAPSVLWPKLVFGVTAIKAQWKDWWITNAQQGAGALDSPATSDAANVIAMPIPASSLPSPRTPLPTHHHPTSRALPSPVHAGPRVHEGTTLPGFEEVIAPNAALMREQPETAAAVIACYHAAWSARYGVKPMISSQDLGLAKRLAASLPGRACELVRLFVADNEPWLVERRHTLNLLTTHRVNAMLAAPSATPMSRVASTAGAWRTRT